MLSLDLPLFVKKGNKNGPKSPVEMFVLSGIDRPLTVIAGLAVGKRNPRPDDRGQMKRPCDAVGAAVRVSRPAMETRPTGPRLAANAGLASTRSGRVASGASPGGVPVLRMFTPKPNVPFAREAVTLQIPPSSLRNR